MFLGYQNDKIAFIAETREELESLPCVTFDKIEEVEFAEMFNGKIYILEEELTQAKGEEVRSTRNSYLETYVDPVVSNPLRWGEMTAEEQQQYADYRRYLLDITESAEFPNVQVMTLDEWKQSLEEISQEPSETTENEEENPVEEIGTYQVSEQVTNQVSD